jgi:hypothetical protein
MKKVALASVGALVLAGALPALAAQQQATAMEPQALLEQGSKWATDAPLREGMEGIRAQVAQLRAKDRFTLADYRSLSKTLDGRIADIVAKCKLAPDADASLHAVIGELNAASAEMRGRWPEPARGLYRAKQALEAYERRFDHPGFAPVG